jgi:hypothetical protein
MNYRTITALIRLFSGERSILHAAGLPDDTLNRLEVVAGRWGVSLREAALALGAVTADDYVKSAARIQGVEVMAAEQIAELEPISPSPEPYRLLESASPVLSRLPHGDFMLNAESCDPETITDLAAALGPKRRQLKLLSRAAMTAAIIKSYGAEIAMRAANGIRLRNPRFSAATGFINWQIMALTILAGCFWGDGICAERSVVALYRRHVPRVADRHRLARYGSNLCDLPLYLPPQRVWAHAKR